MPDKSEYILYQTGEKQRLTNGVNIWETNNKRMVQLEKVEKINVEQMIKRLQHYQPHHGLIRCLQKKQEVMEGSDTY